MRVVPPGLAFKLGCKLQNRLFRALLAVSFLLAACSTAEEPSPTATSPVPISTPSQEATATPSAGALPSAQASHTAPKTTASKTTTPKTAAPLAITPTLPAGTFVN